MSSELRVAISGKSGCGNSTVSRLVADRLGLPMINYTFKDLARDNGMTFEEVCRKAEEGPEFDYLIDRMQVEMAEKGPCVLGSRLAIWLLRDSAFTVYLDAPPPIRAAAPSPAPFRALFGPLFPPVRLFGVGPFALPCRACAVFRSRVCRGGHLHIRPG